VRRAVAALAIVAALVAGALVSSTRAASSAPQAPAAARGQASAPAAFDGTKAFEHLKQMVAIGPRPSGSPELRETRAYITHQLASIGLTVQEQRFIGETPRGAVDMVNLIVRLPGRRADRIVIGGHYDTKPIAGMRFVGASDGASSAAFLVELARALKGRPHDLTYELVWFDGEEAVCRGWDDCGKPGSPDNTYGSRFYVQAAKKAGALSSLKAMILVDMIGADGLILRRETKSTAWLTDTIWNTARRLAYGHVFVDASLPVEDDHLPFLEAGVPSVDLIDLQDYPYWHTADDTLAHVSARSLQIVGDVLIAALPEIDAKLAR
jgi:hypothetical protein